MNARYLMLCLFAVSTTLSFASQPAKPKSPKSKQEEALQGLFLVVPNTNPHLALASMESILQLSKLSARMEALELQIKQREEAFQKTLDEQKKKIESLEAENKSLHAELARRPVEHVSIH